MSKDIVLAKVLAIGTTESGRAWIYGKKLQDEELRVHLWDDLAQHAVSADAAMGALLEHQTEAKEGETRASRYLSASSPASPYMPATSRGGGFQRDDLLTDWLLSPDLS